MIYPMDLKPTEVRLCDVLADGERHGFAELHRVCIDDDLSTIKALQKAVSRLRKKFVPLGMNILCEYHRRSPKYYRLVRLVSRGEG